MISRNSLVTAVKQITLGVCGLAISLSSFAAFNTNPSATGALSTGIYRDLSAEMGKTDAAAKVTDAWNKMFGTDANYNLYNTYGTDKAYIKAPDSGDVRTEGQSWGMTITVMMNKQAEFDKLWRFASTYQRNADGTFGWQVKFDGSGNPYKADAGPAPDGELYFAFALLNADARWGSNSTGINYYSEAVAVLTAIRTKLMVNNMIVFSPSVANVTDPSYNIPAFYNYFANRMSAQSDKDYWNNAATVSRTFLSTHTSTAPNGLPTFLASPAGSYLTGNLFSGQANPAEQYEYDAWRVALNIGLDAQLGGAQAWHKTAINTILYFFKDKYNTSGASACYMQKYAYGAAVSTNNYCADVGQKGANAVALLASTNASDASFFFDQFWATSFPSGIYRYYGGSLHMLSLLHATGQFKFYMPGSGGGSSSAGTNKLLNSDFNNGMTNWIVNYGNGASATSGTSNGTAFVWISTGGTNTYDVQMSQNTTITQGKSYKVEFDGRINEGTTRTIGVNLEKNVSPYTGYGATTVTLGASWNHYTYVFNAVSASDAQARLVLQLGANTNDVNVDNLTLVEQ